jgi:hypothetical protein
VFDFICECCCFTNQNTRLAVNSTCRVIMSCWNTCPIVLECSGVPQNAAECHQVYNCHLHYCIYVHCFCTGYNYVNKFPGDHHSLQLNANFVSLKCNYSVPLFY